MSESDQTVATWVQNKAEKQIYVHSQTLISYATVWINHMGGWGMESQCSDYYILGTISMPQVFLL